MTLLSVIAAAYLGCMRPDAMLPRTNCMLTAGAAPTWAPCPTALTGVVGSNASSCVCIGALPSASTVDAGASVAVCRKRGGISLYHTHGGIGCRLHDVALLPSADSTFVAYNPGMVAYMPANHTMRLSMDGRGEGTRVAVRTPYVYGTFQVDAAVDHTPGVVSAFYLRSDRMQETRDFSEIDFEFINGPSGGPGSVWLNSWRYGMSLGVTLLPRVLRAGTGTFTMAWAPDGVFWYMNGKLLRRSAAVVPPKSSYVTFSIWTSTPPHGNGTFGGVLRKDLQTASRKFHSWFARHRRIVCHRFPLVTRRVVPTPH